MFDSCDIMHFNGWHLSKVIKKGMKMEDVNEVHLFWCWQDYAIYRSLTSEIYSERGASKQTMNNEEKVTIKG